MAIDADTIIADLVGQRYLSDWLTVDQPMIDRFADATGDHQFIHVDPQRAAKTPFGGTIAHGFLLLSLLPRLQGMADRPEIPGLAMGINYGTDRIRFVRPVHAGSDVRAAFHIAEVTQKAPDRFQQTIDVELHTRGQDGPALIARWLGQFVVRG
ncbi:MaoC family dehydratase [Croceicoccus sp. YJ47]|uniref:MaoC family dehydratase n=1 Tax=Croceicoccus sp. YJ47 TaxID=2798724 RepID=UPI001923C203|nr:MaoC family dehydratase [Croceicoccus sp. YJ47]QQN75360.1 MaoC family dehydratase [Croceicoccus sp. YJ47]